MKVQFNRIIALQIESKLDKNHTNPLGHRGIYSRLKSTSSEEVYLQDGLLKTIDVYVDSILFISGTNLVSHLELMENSGPHTVTRHKLRYARVSVLNLRQRRVHLQSSVVTSVYHVFQNAVNQSCILNTAIFTMCTLK